MLTAEEFVARHREGIWLRGQRGGLWLPLRPSGWRAVAWQSGGKWHAKLVRDQTGEEHRCSRPRDHLEEFNAPAAALAYRLQWPNVIVLRRA